MLHSHSKSCLQEWSFERQISVFFRPVIYNKTLNQNNDVDSSSSFFSFFLLQIT